MLKSMTAFGRARRMSSDGALDITAEIRSVNSRYLDCSVRMSRSVSHLEDRVKTALSEAGITRGKVEVYIGVDVLEQRGMEIALDKEAARAYVAALNQLREAFGDRIASLVASESDEVHEGVCEEDSWHARKRAAIERLSHASRDAKMVALGDKLSNMRAIARDYAVQGDALWNLFHAKDRKDHEWHYRGLADALRELSGTFAFKEFEQLINQVFA